jgi:hypothetical protein
VSEQDLTIPELAAATKAELLKRGWAKNGLYHYESSLEVGMGLCKVCLVGAAAAACYGDPKRGYDYVDPTYRAFMLAVADEIHGGNGWYDGDRDFTPETLAHIAVGEVYGWNDAAHRVLFDVIALLDKLAAGGAQ